MVMSWLINTMENDVGQDFIFYKTAKEIWEAAKVMYSDRDNTTDLFEIKGHLHDLRQGETSVTCCFNSLTCLWQQLDTFEEFKWHCVEDGILYKMITKRSAYTSSC